MTVSPTARSVHARMVAAKAMYVYGRQERRRCKEHKLPGDRNLVHAECETLR